MLPRVSTRNSDLALYDVSLSQSRARDESDNASDVQQRGRPVGRVADRQCALADTYYKSRKSLRHRVVGHPHYIGISPASRGDLNRWTPDAASARSRSARWLLTPVLRCWHISARRVLLISGRARRRRRRRHYRRHRRQRNPQAHAHLFAAPSCLRKLLGWVKARRRKMDGENSLIHDSLSLSLFRHASDCGAVALSEGSRVPDKMRGTSECQGCSDTVVLGEDASICRESRAMIGRFLQVQVPARPVLGDYRRSAIDPSIDLVPPNFLGGKARFAFTEMRGAIRVIFSPMRNEGELADPRR